MSRQEVIRQATQAVMSDRNTDYDPPEVNFQRIADLWNTYLDGSDLTPYDTAIMMILVKVARCQASPHLIDHLVDIAGYAACAGDVLPPVFPSPAPPAASAELPGIRVTFEGAGADLRVAFPEPGINTLFRDQGGKLTLTAEQLQRAEDEKVLVYL